MGHDPPYTPAKFGEDSLKPKKVMVKKHRNLNMKNKKNKNNNNNNNNKNIDETLQEQKDIPITWGCPNKNTHFDASICPVLMNEASLERAYTYAHFGIILKNYRPFAQC